MSLPTLLLFGNCQSEALADALRRVPGLIARFHIAYVCSFDMEQHNPARRLAALRAGRVAVVLEQIEATRPAPAWLTEWLPAGVARLRFAPLDCMTLWPFQFDDPRNGPAPGFPFGRYPYGDRLVVELLEDGYTPTTGFYAYLAESPARLPDLARLAHLDGRRLAAREATAEVKMADVVAAELTRRRLFWTYNHPSGWLLAQLAARLLDALRVVLALPAEAVAPGPLWASYEPLRHVQVPVHPHVAQRLALEWCPPGAVTRCSDGVEMTFHAYLRRYFAFEGCL